MLVENARAVAKVEAQRAKLPLLQARRDDARRRRSTDADVLSWEDFLAQGRGARPRPRSTQRIDAIEPDDLATLIYTSGTTGPPKGVMLSHANLAWTAQTLIDDRRRHRRATSSLSYLPLSHIAEQMLTIHCRPPPAAAVYFAESIEKVPDNLKEVQPTVFFGVPRIWEKFHAGIGGKLGRGHRRQEAASSTGRASVGARGQRACATAARSRGALLALQYQLAQQARVSASSSRRSASTARASADQRRRADRATTCSSSSPSLDIADPRGLRPVRGHRPDDVQPARARRKLGTVGPALPGVEVQDRRRRRDPGQGPERVPRLLQGARGDRARR